MVDRAHIRLVDDVWTFQRAYDGPTGFFRDEFGRKTDLAKAPIGYQVGDDKLVAAVETLDDTSTGAETITSRPAWTVEADGSGCSRTVTTRDKTAQEISDEKDDVLSRFDTASRDEVYALAMIMKGTLSLMLELTNTVRANNGQGEINLAQFKTAFEGAEGDITVAQFKTYMKDRLG